jgi:hypothetical protein
MLWQVDGGRRYLPFFCEPPVSDLFVGETKLTEKGLNGSSKFDHHFHPSGAVDLLRYISDLSDIKQKDDNPVVSLKGQFSTAFFSLKTGGIGINSALQVGFMLCALLHRYHAVVVRIHAVQEGFQPGFLNS